MNFFDVLVRYETDLWNHLDHQLDSAGGVSLATLFALRVVRRHNGQCRVQEVGTELGITVGAASKAVDRLVQAGLARRTPHPQDRRSSLIALTPAGDSAHDVGVRLLESTLAEHLANGPDLARLTSALRRLQMRLTEPTLEATR